MDKDNKVHHTQRIPLAQKFAARDADLDKGALLTNCYREPSKAAERIVKRPGYVERGSFINCTGQGMHYFEGDELYVACDTLWVTKLQPLTAAVSTAPTGAGAGEGTSISTSLIPLHATIIGMASNGGTTQAYHLNIATAAASWLPVFGSSKCVASGATSYATFNSVSSPTTVLLYDKTFVNYTSVATSFVDLYEIIWLDGSYYALGQLTFGDVTMGVSEISEAGIIITTFVVSPKAYFQGTDGYLGALLADTNHNGNPGGVGYSSYDSGFSLVNSWASSQFPLGVTAGAGVVFAIESNKDYNDFSPGRLGSLVKYDAAGLELGRVNTPTIVALGVVATPNYVVVIAERGLTHLLDFHVFTLNLEFIATIETPMGSNVGNNIARFDIFA